MPLMLLHISAKPLKAMEHIINVGQLQILGRQGERLLENGSVG